MFALRGLLVDAHARGGGRAGGLLPTGNNASLPVGLATTMQAALVLLVRTAASTVCPKSTIGIASFPVRLLPTHASRHQLSLLFLALAEMALIMHFGMFSLLGVDQPKNIVAVVDAQEELGVHALLHGSDEFSGLNELPDGCPALKPLRDVDLHRRGYLLYFFQSILVNQ